jgi:hypothetical protein
MAQRTEIATPSRQRSWSFLFLSGSDGRQYKQGMHVMGELDREGLPRPIPADELQIMLGNSSVFCSWNASNSTVSDLTTGWPFLFSCPLLGTNESNPT